MESSQADSSIRSCVCVCVYKILIWLLFLLPGWFSELFIFIQVNAMPFRWRPVLWSCAGLRRGNPQHLRCHQHFASPDLAATDARSMAVAWPIVEEHGGIEALWIYLSLHLVWSKGLWRQTNVGQNLQQGRFELRVLWLLRDLPRKWWEWQAMEAASISDRFKYNRFGKISRYDRWWSHWEDASWNSGELSAGTWSKGVAHCCEPSAHGHSSARGGHGETSARATVISERFLYRWLLDQNWFPVLHGICSQKWLPCSRQTLAATWAWKSVRKLSCTLHVASSSRKADKHFVPAHLFVSALAWYRLLTVVGWCFKLGLSWLAQCRSHRSQTTQKRTWHTWKLKNWSIDKLKLPSTLGLLMFWVFITQSGVKVCRRLSTLEVCHSVPKDRAVSPFGWSLGRSAALLAGTVLSKFGQGTQCRVNYFTESIHIPVTQSSERLEAALGSYRMTLTRTSERLDRYKKDGFLFFSGPNEWWDGCSSSKQALKKVA